MQHIRDHFYWEKFRDVMGSTTEYGYEFDYYDELFTMVKYTDDEGHDWDWVEQSHELGQCAKSNVDLEYRKTLPFENEYLN